MGTTLRKEQPAVDNLYHPPRARYRIPEPICPFLIEEYVAQAPRDKRRDLQCLEQRMNGEGMCIVEGQPIALEGLDALPRGQQRLQMEPDGLVRQKARIGVTAKQRHRLAPGIAFTPKIGTVQQGLKYGCERPVSRVLDERQHLRRRPTVMHIAIGQHERCQGLWVVRREDLADGTAAVAASETAPINF